MKDYRLNAYKKNHKRKDPLYVDYPALISRCLTRRGKLDLILRELLDDQEGLGRTFGIIDAVDKIENVFKDL